MRASAQDATESFAGTAPVWSGSGYSDILPPENCHGWSSDLPSLPDGGVNAGSAGDYRSVGAIWRYARLTRCDGRFPITCIEVGAGGGPNHYPPIHSSTKLAFVSQEFYLADFVREATADAGSVDSGLDEVHIVADEKCAAEAALAGLQGTFRAWVASSSSSANAYFQSHGMDGPWSRVDGMPVAQSLEQLGQPDGIAVPLNLTANAIFRTRGYRIWTGFVAESSPAANCNDFTSRSSDVVGRQGTDSFDDHRWFDDFTSSCANLGAGLYCFQE